MDHRQMAPPEHTSDKRAYYSFIDPGHCTVFSKRLLTYNGVIVLHVKVYKIRR